MSMAALTTTAVVLLFVSAMTTCQFRTFLTGAKSMSCYRMEEPVVRHQTGALRRAQ